MAIVSTSIAEALLQELHSEAKATRKMLERVPEDKFGWTPHPKSMTLGRLAAHLAETSSWGIMTCEQDEFNMEGEYTPWTPSSREEILKKFDEDLETFINVLTKTSDEQMMATWRFKMNGQVAFEMPRVAVLRSMILNHSVHHRGQLSVYLRMHDVPLPAIYGPSADEQG